jgi:hypothetical protein
MTHHAGGWTPTDVIAVIANPYSAIPSPPTCSASTSPLWTKTPGSASTWNLSRSWAPRPICATCSSCSRPDTKPRALHNERAARAPDGRRPHSVDTAMPAPLHDLPAPTRCTPARDHPHNGQERKLRRDPPTHTGRRVAPGPATARDRTARPHRGHSPVRRIRTLPDPHPTDGQLNTVNNDAGQMRQDVAQAPMIAPPAPYIVDDRRDQSQSTKWPDPDPFSGGADTGSARRL